MFLSFSFVSFLAIFDASEWRFVSSSLFIAGNLIAIPTAMLAIIMIFIISRNQEDRYRLLLTQPLPADPILDTEDTYTFLRNV